MIKIEHLNKYYNKGKNNEIHVINDATLELPNTGLISFLGASGSGKTTLLNVIGGLDKAKGSITYDDLTLENYKMHQVDRFRSREIGYVFQNYNLLLEETVYSNLEIALEMIGIFDKEEQEKRIEYTLKAVGMYKYRKKRAYALSGGQQQRVSIARALVKKSKIIIADEPTGNLDNENTIEVMNILKKVSKTSLVLVVTHNEEVANFYSDEVIRIKDGSIIDNYKSDGSGQLKTEQNNTIYLKDLSLQEEKGNLVSLQYYTTKEAKPLELRIIEKNGTYYISASEKLKLLDETNIKVLDSHYEALKQESVDQFDYDTSWFSDSKGKDNPFKRLWNSLKTSFNKMRFSKRRAKFLYFSFFLIGIILAICTIGFANYYIVDDSQISVDSNFQVLKTDSYLSYEHFRTETIQLMDAGEIEALNVPITMYTRFFKSINYVETANQGMNLSAISFYGCDHLNFLIGKAPEKNEVVISQKVADTLIKNSTYFSSYQDLLGIRMTGLKGNDYKVCGVVDNPYLLVYINDDDYLSYIAGGNDYNTDNLVVKRNYTLEKKHNTYEILEGRDLDENDYETKNILVPYRLKDSLNDSVTINGSKYNVVGVYRFREYEDSSTCFIINEEKVKTIHNNLTRTAYNYESYKIIEGREPQNYRECIASAYSYYKVGNKVTGLYSNMEYTVVGVYYADSATLNKDVLYSREGVLIDYTPYSWLKFKDNQKAMELIQKDSFYLRSTYDAQYIPMKEDQREGLLVFGILSVVLLATIAVFIYFMMRSRMIADIYPIGVYRSIGASRAKLFRRFISDIFVTITLTSLIGYLITMFIFNTISASINDTLEMNILKNSTLFSFLGVLILYGLNFIFGLIPIFMLMRKTPAEIIAKYDI